MFYSDTTAYPFLPNLDQMQKVSAQGYRLAVMKKGELDFVQWQARLPEEWSRKILRVDPVLVVERKNFIEKIRSWNN